jgi:prepilin-type N-terminal cleavage/methylation domain-containing protein
MMLGSRTKTQRAFTLIELLVVIAIISMLSSIVLTSVSSARSKGADSGVKSTLVSARTEAEIFFDTNQSYTGVCGVPGAPGVTKLNVIGGMINAAERLHHGSVTAYNNALNSGWTSGQCHETAQAWAAVSPLSASASGLPVHFCVDSKSAGKQISVNLAINATVCP